MISVVCPFYNEELILDAAIRLMLKNLKTLADDWELVIVNDGSTDASPEIARRIESEDSRLRVVSYENNHGRGHALMTGITASRGEIIITTESDCSWGDDVVRRLADALRENPNADIVIASPHRPGGGFRNVPLMRVFFSTLGNIIIRTFFMNGITMSTGMTRGYRRNVFDTLTATEKGKEFHLEVLLKALSFRMNIIEIPCIVEWRHRALAASADAAPRRSSSRIGEIIRDYTFFIILANPAHCLRLCAGALFAAGLFFMALGIVRFLHHQALLFPALCFLGAMGAAILFFGFGLLAAQRGMIERELWRVQ